eukprot:17440-Heterococcus_DN1.PRE.2
MMYSISGYRPGRTSCMQASSDCAVAYQWPPNNTLTFSNSSHHIRAHWLARDLGIVDHLSKLRRSNKSAAALETDDAHLR